MIGNPYLAFIEGIGGPELMMVLFVVLMLFGGKKLPELAKGLGKSMREFKKAASGVEEEFKRAIEDAPDTTASPPPPAGRPASPGRPSPPET
jgi:TatA/E family protein of Tat protein translocase